MRADLIILTPSRGRPESVRRLINACHDTCQAATALFFAFDRDDPELTQNIDAARTAPRSTRFVVGPRDTLSGWTNVMARMTVTEAGALASLGDDHVPLTKGWDRKLLEIISSSGGTGIAYGDDLLAREKLPTAPVISSNIVEALGWYCLPELTHMCVDSVWKELGEAAGCLYYVPEVKIRHMHHSLPGGVPDATSHEVDKSYGPDVPAFYAWQRGDKDLHADIVRELVSHGT